MRNSILLVAIISLAIYYVGCGQVKEQELKNDIEHSNVSMISDAEQNGDSNLGTNDETGQMYEALQPGNYIVSSIGENGDITFYSTLDAVNGYLRLNEDHTGVLMLGSEEKSLTWEENTITCGEEIIFGYTISSSDAEIEEMVMLYIMDRKMSVVLYPAED